MSKKTFNFRSCDLLIVIRQSMPFLCAADLAE